MSKDAINGVEKYASDRVIVAARGGGDGTDNGDGNVETRPQLYVLL